MYTTALEGMAGQFFGSWLGFYRFSQDGKEISEKYEQLAGTVPSKRVDTT